MRSDGRERGALARRRGERVVPVPAPTDGGDEERGGSIEDAFPIFRVLNEDGTAECGEIAMPDEDLVDLYRWMVLSRQIDERMVPMQRQGRISFYVGETGEEAAVLGSVRGMEPKDWIVPCYREHVAALFRGLPLETFFCNLFCNSGDIVLGRQMPCHETWRPGLFVSVGSTVGTQITHAVGAAWAARIRGEEMVSLVYFGDGATSSNDFHSACTVAAVRKVPVIFLCRNNGWAISTPLEQQTAAQTMAQKAIAYGMRGERVDGNDILAVYEATRSARARAARGEGPTLLECVTYRVEAHTTSDDPLVYRNPALVEPWRKKDPLLRMKRFLERRGLIAEDGDERFVAEARERILRAIKAAEAHAPKPPIESLFEGVYAEPLRQQREQLEELRGALEEDPRVGDVHGDRR